MRVNRSILWAIAVLSCLAARAQAAQPQAESAFECLRTSADAKLLVSVEYKGCFGGTTESIRLARYGELATLRGDIGTLGVQAREVPLDDRGLEDLLKRLRDAVVRPEERSWCTSTTHVTTRLSWCCRRRSGKPETGSLSYFTDDCLDGSAGDPSLRSVPGEGYQRGAGVRRVVDRVLVELLLEDLAMMKLHELHEAHMDDKLPPTTRILDTDPDWKAVATPPPPPKRMLAEACPKGLKLRYSVSRAPQIGHPDAIQWVRDCVDPDGHPHGRWSEWTNDGRVIHAAIWPEGGATISPTDAGEAAGPKPAGGIPPCRPLEGVIWQHEWMHPADGGWERCRPFLP